MQVTITHEDVVTVRGQGDRIVITGTAENGDRVTFSGDPEDMEEIAVALVMDMEDDVVIDVEPHQIVGVKRFDLSLRAR